MEDVYPDQLHVKPIQYMVNIWYSIWYIFYHMNNILVV